MTTDGSGQGDQPAAGVGPLAGLRVVDFGRFAVGPAAGMYLGQLGAEVIKIESPTGDGSQKVMPLKQGVSIVYMTVNSCKQNILLDLRDPADRDVAFRLACSADVLIENFRTGVIDRLGLGYEAVSAVNPRIVYGSASGYGSRGPMRELGSTDHFGQAISGFVSVNGSPGGEPELLRQAGFVDMASAQRLLQAILAGLYIRERTGRGQKVETSQLAAGLGLVITRLAEAALGDASPEPLGSASPTCVPSQAFRCADGQWLFVSTETPDQWQRLCQALGRADLAEDHRFASNRMRVAHRDALVAVLSACFAEQPAADWEQRLLQHGVPAALHWAAPTHAPLWSDPHVTAAALSQMVETPWGRVRIVRPPWQFSETPATLTRSPRPDEHGVEIRQRLAAPAQEDAAAASPAHTNGASRSAASAFTVSRGGAASDGRPFAPLRVVDISQGYAGPSCSMLLGDLGADVVKVEPPQGDYTRELGPPFVGNESTPYLSVNRSKRGVVLDLETAGGRAALDRLLATADVFISDLLPAEAARLGLDDATLRTRLSALVHCVITPFGEAGPYVARPASELTVQGFAGIGRFLGALDEPPVRLGADVVGLTAGVHAFVGIVSALIRQARTGRGQKVGIDQLLTLLSTECSQLARESDPDEWIGPVRAASQPPEHPYPTADVPVYFTLARTGQEDTWPRFFRDLGLPALADDSRFAGQRQRQAHHHELAEAMAPRLAQLQADEILALVYRHGGLGVRAHTLRSVLDDPQVAATEMLVTVQHPDLGPLRGVNVPFELVMTRPSVTLPPPRLGEHTHEVLNELRTHTEGTGGHRS